jgi:hypothetical protein
MINRTTITIHTRQRTVVRPLSDAPLVRCPECRTDVLVVSAESAAAILDAPPAIISRLIESGTLHAINPGDENLICCNSLFAVSPTAERKLLK